MYRVDIHIDRFYYKYTTKLIGLIIGRSRSFFRSR